jgi:hypothetical protein
MKEEEKEWEVKGAVDEEGEVVGTPHEFINGPFKDLQLSKHTSL